MFDDRIIVNKTIDSSFESTDTVLTNYSLGLSNISPTPTPTKVADGTDRATCCEVSGTINAGPSGQISLFNIVAKSGYCRPGDVIACGADYKMVAGPGTFANFRRRLRVRFWQEDRLTLSAIASTILIVTEVPTDNEWHRLDGLCVAPADAFWYAVEPLASNDGGLGTFTVRFDAFMAARFSNPDAGLVDYFDGASQGGNWDGVADKSTSWRWNYDLASPMGDELFEGFAPLVEAFGDPDNNLRDYCRSMGMMIQPLDDIARDGDNGEPGFSQILDLTRGKAEWIPWLSQFVGYPAPERRPEQDREWYLDTERSRTITRSAHRRGTIARMVEEVQTFLNDPKTVFVQQRVGTAHRMTIFYYTAMLNPNFTAGQLAAAAQAQKAKGLILTVTPLSGGDWNTLIANQATWNVVKTKFANWNEVISNPAKP